GEADHQLVAGAVPVQVAIDVDIAILGLHQVPRLRAAEPPLDLADRGPARADLGHLGGVDRLADDHVHAPRHEGHTDRQEDRCELTTPASPPLLSFWKVRWACFSNGSDRSHDCASSRNGSGSWA